MSPSKITAVVVAVCTAAAPLLPLLVDQHILKANAASVIGGFLVTFAGAWHGNSFLSARAASAVSTVGSDLVQIGTRGTAPTDGA